MSAGGLGIYTVDLFLKVRLAVSEGMSRREAAKHFNISRDSVAKMMSYSVPPGYQRQLRIPDYPAGHSSDIRPSKPGYPATLI